MLVFNPLQHFPIHHTHMAANAPSPDTSATSDAAPNQPIQSSLKQNLAEFLSARVELASIEAAEAAERTATKLVHGIILAFCAFFTWALLLASLTGFLAPFINQWIGDKADHIPGWAVALLLLGILHGIVAFVFFGKLKKKPATPLFELSRKELELDKQWLTKNK